MLRNQIYYRLKPVIPASLRRAMRQRVAARIRQRIDDVWPAFPGSERPPAGWIGWPNGKRFAVVLTHDVEGQVGLDNCRRLMQLEREMGFKSSFNFIPEGTYRVPHELREELVNSGFEVGVHDLRHDGRLYHSRRVFSRNAVQINHYLKEWNAAGFRSGFMLHNLNWLHELDIRYDMSTFDTDPFEPQPEGYHTIFPFWVARPTPLNGSLVNGNGPAEGYVELPYTLPQDSTLYLLLHEKTPDIWLRKSDWIAEHGGMILVNVHPDYLSFDGKPQPGRTYTAAHYEQWLQQVRCRYDSTFWQPLAKDLAHFVARLAPKPTVRRTRRVGMISHSVYRQDNRVRRYAEALAARGDHVDVFVLRRSPEKSKCEKIGSINIFRVQDRFEKSERSKLGYLWPLLQFFAIVSRRLTTRHFRQPYDLIHIHNIPDFLVFSAWYPKLAGVPVILDIHDIVPEFFASKFRMSHKGITFTLLQWMERVSAAFADHIIVANHLWLEKYSQRTGSEGRCTVLINHVDSSIFAPSSTARRGDKLIVLYPGGLQWHQGLDIALRAFKQISTELPTAEFHIYGDGSARESLIALSAALQLNGKVRFFHPKEAREIARTMADADLGVVPKRADSFGNEAYSTKIMEFMAVGVPVIVSNTKVDQFYFDESVVRFFESGNPDALAREMIELLTNVELRRQMITRASEYAARNCWDKRKADYLNLVDRLCADMPVTKLAEVEEATIAKTA